MTDKVETEITRYTIVSSADKDVIVSTVELNLKNGWELYGDLALSSQNGMWYFAQAMVRLSVKDTRGAWG